MSSWKFCLRKDTGGLSVWKGPFQKSTKILHRFSTVARVQKISLLQWLLYHKQSAQNVQYHQHCTVTTHTAHTQKLILGGGTFPQLGRLISCLVKGETMICTEKSSSQSPADRLLHWSSSKSIPHHSQSTLTHSLHPVFFPCNFLVIARPAAFSFQFSGQLSQTSLKTLFISLRLLK